MVLPMMRCFLFSPALPQVISALTTLVLGGGTARAVVVHVDWSAAPLVVPDTLDGIYLNFVTGTTSPTPVTPAIWDFNPYNVGPGRGLSFFAPSLVSGQGTLVSGQTALSLVGGETIGPAGIYQPGQALGTNFQITGINFVGLRFQNEMTGQLNYGWARLNSTATSGFPLSILGYAYENTGAAIVAGAVPEPAGTGLLVLSGAWLAARRRRGKA